MDRQDLNLIKTRTLFLTEGVTSSEIVLKDDVGGDMYFKVKIEYVEEDERSTDFSVTDPFHADVTIKTTPDSFTRLNEPQNIGKYGDKELFFDFLVEPWISEEDGHKVTISFYTN